MIETKENVIEWITGQERVTITLSQRRLITKIKALAEKYPDEVEISIENKDGSVVAHLPLSYISVKHPKTFSDEAKDKAKERMLYARSKRKTAS